MLKLLVTGGAGFIGSAFVRYAAQKSHSITVVDKITYASDIKRLKSVRDKISFHKIDICDNKRMTSIVKKVRPDIIIHFAAETHVDRSILNTSPFILTNIQGTANLIDLALKYKVKKLIHISTDEVYGEISKGSFTEKSPIKPNNPYSSSKAAADFLVLSALRAYKLPAIIARPCNCYGPWQYPEKFIPVAILKALLNQKIPIYGKGINVREWIYVDDCARALLTILQKGKAGEIYNIGTGEERKNIETARSILSILDKPRTQYHFMKDRPGHDLRYSSQCAKLKKLGWKPETLFETGLEKTILWIEENEEWMQKKAKDLKDYWQKIYKAKD